MTCKQQVKMQFLQISFKFAGAKKTLSTRVMTKINHARLVNNQTTRIFIYPLLSEIIGLNGSALSMF